MIAHIIQIFCIAAILPCALFAMWFDTYEETP